MIIHIQYKFRGNNREKLISDLKRLDSLLESKGHTVLIALKNLEDWGNKKYEPHSELMSETLRLIDRADATLAFFLNLEPSEGRGFEIGYAKAKGKKTILAIHKNFRDEFTESWFDKVIVFDKVEDIAKNF